jgi:uncharacterized protein YbjT (DUF2867 family)
MRVLVIGSSRGTGRLVVDQLIADGHEVRAMVRDAGQQQDLEVAGAQTVVGDLEGELAPAFDGVEAVMFCAGSGSKTGPDATLRVDLHGAVRSIDLALDVDARRYVMLSSIGADDPLRGGGAPAHYLAAKHAADRILLASGLDATVVRPGGLTHDEGTGAVRLGVPRLGERGRIPRADVAALMVGCLDLPNTYGAVFEAISGDTPVERALQAL